MIASYKLPNLKEDAIVYWGFALHMAAIVAEGDGNVSSKLQECEIEGWR